jgi:succinoglycan biosynthesis transport protein ExoP
MMRLIEELRPAYDYVFIDLPPLIPVVDARATVNFVDSYIYVVEWGCTKVHAAKYALANAPDLYRRLLGVVVNKVNMSAVRRYERYGGHDLHNEYSASYRGPEASSG